MPQQKTKKIAASILRIQDFFRKNIKWFIGSFQPEESPFHSNRLEIGAADSFILDIERQELHHHEKATEYYICLRGQVEVAFTDQSIILTPFDLLKIPPGLQHRITKYSNDVRILLIKDRATIDRQDKKIVP